MSRLQRQQADIVIVGAGMIGLSLAVLLAKQKRRVVVVERHPQPGLSDELALRVSALNARSQSILKHCDVWQAICEFRCGLYQGMQVWDKDSPARIEFGAQDVDAENLGVIVENNVVEHFLWQRAEQLGVDIQQADDWQLLEAGDDSQRVELQLAGTLLQADLLVGADGGRSLVRQRNELPLTFWDYQQQGIVANIATELPHQGIARQVFLPTGPLALLPTADSHTVSIVWSADQAFAETLLQEGSERLAQRVAAESGRVLGTCRTVSEVKAFPLRMQYARQWYQQRIVLVGDAAHTIHPLAGQGANLGFGDVQALVAQLEASELKPLNRLHRRLAAYQRQRKAETQVMIAAMEAFKRGFGSANPVLKGVRALAFALPNRLSLLKRQLAHIAIGKA
ncbi:FAD-dependent oxidoreductase [Idiomarina seosinensis]|uniref:FAD-dependent oxidoreductase n=1 Tax=Idiomarina seosinensis TaxID=281739 RepID=UPI00384F000F